MDIEVLQNFLTITREENISRAAKVLHITQPTLSRQMAALEEELGMQLFVRGKKLELTDAGLRLKSRAEEIDRLMDKIESEFHQDEELSGVITIGTGRLNSTNMLNKAITEFKAKHPRVEFEIYVNNGNYIKDRMDRGLLDFGLMLEPINVEKYDCIRMKTPERWGLLMKADHKLAKKDRIVKGDLVNLPIITTNRTKWRKDLENWLGMQAEYLNIFATYSLASLADEFIGEGYACAIVLESSIGLLDMSKLAFRPLYPELTSTSVIAWRRFDSSFSTAGRFLEYLKKYAQQE